MSSSLSGACRIVLRVFLSTETAPTRQLHVGDHPASNIYDGYSDRRFDCIVLFIDLLTHYPAFYSKVDLFPAWILCGETFSQEVPAQKYLLKHSTQTPFQ